MAEKPKVKRQHYVPRLLLRKFSQNEDSIAMLVLDTVRRIPSASIATQCQKPYFYGEDQRLEQAFGVAETQFAAAIGNLSREHLDSLSAKALYQIRQFTHYQRHRTLAAADDISEMIDLVIKTSVRGRPDFPPDLDLDKVRIEVNHPQLRVLHQALLSTPLLLDLDVKFAVSDRPLGFVLSDHPVVFQNHWAENHPFFQDARGTCGLAHKGLQMFLPISPRVCVCVFDPRCYEYGSHKRRTFNVGLHDIRLMNHLQVLNAFNSLYYDPSATPEGELERLTKIRARGAGRLDRLTVEGRPRLRPDGNVGVPTAISAKEIRVGAQLNSAKIIDRDPHTGHSSLFMPTRMPDPQEAVKGYEDFLRTEYGLTDLRPSEGAKG